MKRVLALAMLMASTAASQGWAVSPLKEEVRVYGFQTGTDGSHPRGDLLKVPDGSAYAMYGTTANGGAGNAGTVFKIKVGKGTNPSIETQIWSFDGGAEGSFPSGGLVDDSAGALYGTTALDGASHGGTVFRLQPPTGDSNSWTETTLWSFGSGSDGATPLGSLIFDQSGSGVLYGTTSFGGTHGLGTVFSLTPPASQGGAWTETILWSFTGGADGAKPVATLVQDATGVLYGTAEEGGAGQAGTVFALMPPSSAPGAWTLSPIWTFTGGNDGATPVGTLFLDEAGTIFGTAQFGGSGFCPITRWPYYGEPDSVTAPALNAPYVGIGQNGCGVVFKLTPPATPGGAWIQTLPWSFAGGFDGANPVSKVIKVQQELWGTTPLYGGDPNSKTFYPSFDGNVFKLTPPSTPGGAYTQTTVNSFAFKTGGFYPRSGLVAGPDGRYYNTNTFGGPSWVHVKEYGLGEITAVEKSGK